MKLNLACGGVTWAGFENTDRDTLDIEHIPYPHKNNSADLILISHGLFMTENGRPCHPDLNRLFREWHRILKPKGWLRVDDNPLRCYRDGEHVDQYEIMNEATRGYPDNLRITRDSFCLMLSDAGFRRVEEIPSDATLIAADEETREAILGNRIWHVSFTVEAQK